MRNYLWAAVTAALLATPQLVHSFEVDSSREILAPTDLGRCGVDAIPRRAPGLTSVRLFEYGLTRYCRVVGGRL
jgi:hypothetical protein